METKQRPYAAPVATAQRLSAVVNGSGGSTTDCNCRGGHNSG